MKKATPKKSRPRKYSRSSKTVDVYQMITDQIISKLDEGVIPWRKGWKVTGAAAPMNADGKLYRGVNRMILSCAGYESPVWLTYKKAQALGGHVRKGETSTSIIFWKWIEKKTDEIDELTGERKIKKFAMLRYFNVFNVAQCEGLDESKLPKIETGDDEYQDHEPIEIAEALAAGMPNAPEVRTGHQDRAYYRPSSDYVSVPSLDCFDLAEEYYSTLFHELAHATGHQSRLGRDLSGLFGDHSYSKEELVAEMTAAFLCGTAGIEDKTIDNSAAYIDSWRKKISEDKELVIKAAALAQKAADYIVGAQGQDESEDDSESVSEPVAVAA